jgi:ATPase subunit of ABC transporter with duplicated ATPase domains
MSGVNRLPPCSSSTTSGSKGGSTGSSNGSNLNGAWAQQQQQQQEAGQQQASPSPYADLLSGADSSSSIGSSSIGSSAGVLVSAGGVELTALGTKQQQQQQQQGPAAAAAVSIAGCSFAWGPDESSVLHDVDLSLPPGGLVMVVGPVGSGKSSLLAAVLGELVARPAAASGGAAAARDTSSGGGCGVSVAGSVAYTAQVGGCGMGVEGGVGAGCICAQSH